MELFMCLNFDMLVFNLHSTGCCFDFRHIKQQGIINFLQRITIIFTIKPTVMHILCISFFVSRFPPKQNVFLHVFQHVGTVAVQKHHRYVVLLTAGIKVSKGRTDFQLHACSVTICQLRSAQHNTHDFYVELFNIYFCSSTYLLCVEKCFIIWYCCSFKLLLLMYRYQVQLFCHTNTAKSVDKGYKFRFLFVHENKKQTKCHLKYSDLNNGKKYLKWLKPAKAGCA